MRRENFSDQEIEQLVRKAARYLVEFETGSSVAEVADCAWDESEYTCYLTPADELEVYGSITSVVFDLFNLDHGSSDATDISQAELVRVGGVEPKKE